MNPTPLPALLQRVAFRIPLLFLIIPRIYMLGQRNQSPCPNVSLSGRVVCYYYPRFSCCDDLIGFLGQ